MDVENKMITLRNQQVILDSDVAELYGVQTKEINQAVISPPPYCQDYFCKYLNVNYLQFYLLVKFALLCLISVSVQSNKNN